MMHLPPPVFVRFGAAAIAGGWVLFAVAAAAESTPCHRAGETRLIGIESPGVRGRACDVVVTHAGVASRPFFAENDSAFCVGKAAAIVARLVAEGFDCSSADAGAAAAPSLRAALEGASQDGAGETPTAEAPAMTATSEEGARTPAPLVARGHHDVIAAIPVTDRRPGRGRFVGATPAETATPSIPIIGAAIFADDGAKGSGASAGRPAADLVRAVMAARAAAWNDGDVDGVMSLYWRSADLRVVSAGGVMKGWDATRAALRPRFAPSGAAPSVLRFEGLDVQIVDPTLAVVSGVQSFEAGGEVSRATFTLVMRPVDGAWRIVHEHVLAVSELAAQPLQGP